VLILY